MTQNYLHCTLAIGLVTADLSVVIWGACEPLEIELLLLSEVNTRRCLLSKCLLYSVGNLAPANTQCIPLSFTHTVYTLPVLGYHFVSYDPEKLTLYLFDSRLDYSSPSHNYSLDIPNPTLLTSQCSLQNRPFATIPPSPSHPETIRQMRNTDFIFKKPGKLLNWRTWYRDKIK